jgi:hypothetical protein
VANRSAFQVVVYVIGSDKVHVSSDRVHVSNACISACHSNWVHVIGSDRVHVIIGLGSDTA